MKQNEMIYNSLLAKNITIEFKKIGCVDGISEEEYLELLNNENSKLKELVKLHKPVQQPKEIKVKEIKVKEIKVKEIKENEENEEDLKKSYSYKKISHVKDMLKMSNETNEKVPYTDKQFEEDLKKWLSESKIIQNDKVDKFIECFKRENM